MYDERKNKFSFKNFFLTILIILLFIFLMLWLFPTRSDFNKLKNNNVTDQVYDLNRLSVLYDEIFKNNVARMKEAAIGYFTNERLPQKLRESKKLTLQEMYDLHLVLKMNDKNGNPCDTKKSYVEITKYTEEYRLKVNLSCGTDEDYIIVYLGCYNYCPDGICEKKEPTPSPKTESEQLYCKAVKGIYYGKDGQQVNKETYDKECGTTPTEPKKYSCQVVDGKYYDKNGNVVDKTAYDKSCTPTEPKKYSCQVVDGKYYDKNGNVVDKTAYDKSCTSTEPKKYSCQVVDGKYYDKNGNVVDKTAYDKSCTSTETKKYLYEYKNNPQPVTTCSVWSEWQKQPVTATSNIKVETKVVNEVVGYKEVTVQVGTEIKKVTKQVPEQYISDYTTELVVVGSHQVKTNKTTTQTRTEKVPVGTAEVYAGIGSGTKVPQDTEKVHYKNVVADTPTSCSYCENETKYTWEVWNVETVYETKEITEEVPVYKTVYEYEEKKVPVYSWRMKEVTEEVKVPITEKRKVDVKGDVTYYRYQTCKTTKADPDTKWSESKEDKDLISKGYTFTGNVKQV